MKIVELNSLIEAGTETQSLDFKGDCPWDVKKFAKDLLAMSNIQDGGKIIIGVNENDDDTYEKVGVSTTNKSTYKRDVMMDQMTKYADPHVSFTVDLVTDTAKLDFVVINILPFEEIPIICRIDGVDTQAGSLYYRNRNKRPESAKVSNSFDMRDIIERAAIKLMQRAKKIGYEVPDRDGKVKQSLKNERGNL